MATRGRVVRLNAATEEIVCDLEARAMKQNGHVPARSETLEACVRTFHELVTGKVSLPELSPELEVRRIVLKTLLIVGKRLPDMIRDATGVRVAVEILADGGFRIRSLGELSDAELRPTDFQIQSQAEAN